RVEELAGKSHGFRGREHAARPELLFKRAPPKRLEDEDRAAVAEEAVGSSSERVFFIIDHGHLGEGLGLPALPFYTAHRSHPPGVSEKVQGIPARIAGPHCDARRSLPLRPSLLRRSSPRDPPPPGASPARPCPVPSTHRARSESAAITIA